MTHQPTIPRVKVSGGEDLLGLVPYLLGFHPEESVVVLFFEGTALEMAARLDLAHTHVAGFVDAQLGQVFDRMTEPRLVLAAYAADLEQAHAACAAVEVSLGADRLIDSLVVHEGRWWSRTCQGCCPPEGQPLPDASAAQAAAVLAGCSVIGTRADVALTVAGPDLAAQADLRPRFARRQKHWDAKTLTERREAMSRIVRRATRRPLSGLAAVDLAVLADEVAVRDVAWLQMDRASARKHLELWLRVGETCVDAYATPVLCLTAFAAWLTGNGALMSCCLERAEQLEPDYSMLRLLNEMQAKAAPPAMWDAVSTEVGE